MPNYLKIILTVLVFPAILFVSSAATNLKTIYAAPCSFELSPHQINPNNGSFAVTVNGETGKNYEIRFFIGGNSLVPNTPTLNLQITTGTSATLNINIADINNIKNWISGSSFEIHVQTSSPITGCTTSDGRIYIGSSTRTETCSVTSQDLGEAQRFTITGNGFRTGIPHTIHFGNYILLNLESTGSGNWSKIITIPSNDFPNVIPASTYTVSIHDTDGSPVTCGSVTLERASTQGTAPGKNPCGVGPTGSCETALGNIPTSTSGFASTILFIATGLAGGIALIFMVIGAIRVLTSSGDQQKLNGGRDMIVAALSGLLFLIFSVLILRFLGQNILGGVPGF